MSNHRHRAYGLTISSFVPLDLDPGDGEPDIVVSRRRLPGVGAPLDEDLGSAFAGGTPGRVKLRVPGVFAAEVCDGSELFMDPSPSHGPEVLGDFVLQPLLAYAMMQRGHLLLHASCAEVGGRAIGFIGGSGQGKSTIAAALLARGHRVVCDDVLAVTDDGRALPGVTRLKLLPSAARAVGHDPDRLEPCAAEPMKRRLRPPSPSREEPVPLHRLYVLADEEEVRIEVLGPGEAFRELVCHSHGISAIRAFAQREHFAQLTRLFSPGLVRWLGRPRDLDALGALVGRIESDAGVSPDLAVTVDRP